jgi:hypothetical protein
VDKSYFLGELLLLCFVISIFKKKNVKLTHLLTYSNNYKAQVTRIALIGLAPYYATAYSLYNK